MSHPYQGSDPWRHIPIQSSWECTPTPSSFHSSLISLILSFYLPRHPPPPLLPPPPTFPPSFPIFFSPPPPSPHPSPFLLLLLLLLLLLILLLVFLLIFLLSPASFFFPLFSLLFNAIYCLLGCLKHHLVFFTDSSQQQDLPKHWSFLIPKYPHSSRSEGAIGQSPSGMTVNGNTLKLSTTLPYHVLHIFQTCSCINPFAPHTRVRNLVPHTCYVISLNDHITGIYDTQLIQGEEIFGTASK